MSHRAVEMILTRQLASYLAMPIFIVDPAGTLIYYNEAAEVVLGKRFDETGEMPVDAWATAFRPAGADGSLLPVDALPLSIALTTRRPAHGEIWIDGLDGGRRRICI